MSEQRYRKSAPAWLKSGLIVEEPTLAALSSDGPPQVPARLVPTRDEYALPAHVLTNVINATQRLIFFSAQEAAFGMNPDLASIREIDKSVLEVATLQVSPFGAGSFVIPAELAEVSIDVPGSLEKKLHTSSIVRTFHRLMSRFVGDYTDAAAACSIGFIQTLEEMGKIVGQHAKMIEYTPSGIAVDTISTTITVDHVFVGRAVEAHSRRRGQKKAGFGTAAGLLVELNVVNLSLKLAVTRDNRSFTVRGSFDSILTEQLKRRLGLGVILSGPAEFRKGIVSRITVTEFADMEENGELFS